MQPVTEGRSNAGRRGRLMLFRGMRPFHAARAIRDALAGIELAAMSIPQALGYTSIAGMPAVTGFYTLLLPLLAFATFGSATAAILAGEVSGMAPLASAKYVALAAQPAAVTAIPGVVFSGSDDGHLRSYATEDGRVLWDFDTVRQYQTSNGVRGKGGSLDGAGPVLVGGMLFVNSGYARNGGIAGNVLLAFAPEE
jgi:hypothetical protein